MEKEPLNDNDKKLLAFCSEEKTTRQIAEFLGIAVKNVSVRLSKLENMNLIELNKRGRGKVTTIRTAGLDRKKQYLLKLLEGIKKKGSVTSEEYSKILDYESPQDAMEVTTLLPLIKPKLIERRIFLTPEGLAFLKEHKTNKD